MIHTMLEVDAVADWWESMPHEVRADVEEAKKKGDKVESHEVFF
ncbi:MAG: hypothetical protein ABIN89_18095 [Chitinophagaceae bacterium]